MVSHLSVVYLILHKGLYGAYLPNKSWAFPYSEVIPQVGAQYQPLVCGNASFASRFTCVTSGRLVTQCRPILQRASCLASTYSIVVVLDLADCQPARLCSENCESSDCHLYNTQVAFSEEGRVIIFLVCTGVTWLVVGKIPQNSFVL